MESRTQFTFYSSFFESARRIRSKSARADLYDAICRYALTGEEPDLDKMPESAAVSFLNAKPNLSVSRKRANAGEAGGKSTQAKRKQSQANGKQTSSKTESASESVRSEKEKEYECTPLTPHDESESTVSPGADFEKLWNTYPSVRRGRYEEAREAFFTTILSEDEAQEALDNLTLWKQSDQWNKNGGQYVPYLANWLTRGIWHEAPPIPSGKDVKASCTLGPTELEAIQAVLNQPDLEEDCYE